MAHTDPHGHAPHGHAAHPGHAPAVGHETTDASLGGVERFMVVIAVFLAICFVLVWFMFQYLTSREQVLDVRPAPATGRQGDRLPPLPRLQTVPYGDLAAFRKAEDAALNAWAWTDAGQSHARIPVSRAIEILAEQGLPVPPPSAAPSAPPGGATTPPTASPPAQPGKPPGQ